MPNVFLDKFTLVLVRLLGLVALVWQVIQFFTGRWADEWHKEVGMLLIFFVLARYPKEILLFFKKIVRKITN